MLLSSCLLGREGEVGMVETLNLYETRFHSITKDKLPNTIMLFFKFWKAGVETTFHLPSLNLALESIICIN